MASIVNTKGVDISSNNGNIDLAKVKKAGYGWVMIRCGYGNDSAEQDDSQFSSNVAKAEKLGMPWGVYLFSYACSTADAKSELAHIDRLLKAERKKGHYPSLPIAIDIEPSNYVSSKGGWTKSNLTNVATIVLDGLAKLGYYPMIYTGYSELDDMLSDHIRKDYDCWFAQWNTKPNAYKYNRLGMWQYGGETNFIESNSISGVGVIDKNFAYKDYPTIIKNGGYNGFAKSKPNKVKICRNSLTTYVGTKYAFWCTGTSNPRWTSSNTAVATIDSNGIMTAKATGTTTITVTDGKTASSCKVTLKKGESTGVNYTFVTMSKGTKFKLKARKGRNVTWFSSNTNVATVSGGTVKAKALGYATINAYDKKGSSTCVIKVVEKVQKSPKIKICRKKLTTYAWTKYAFWQTGATNPKWSTSNTNISKIDSNGILTTTAAGTTVVTVSEGTSSASCQVTLNNGKPTGVTPSSVKLSVGQKTTLKANTNDVTWFTSNPNVATVSKGVVTAKAVGYATINAYNKKGSSTCVVQVVKAPSVTETSLREKAANIINSWLGAVEGDKTHAEILKIYNNQSNLPYGYKMGTHDAWCAATVSAVWLKMGIAQYTGTDCNCGGFRDKAISKGIWVENDAYKPKIGDAVIYNWSDDGIGDNKGSADHIGLVTGVSGNTFVVTEGNTGNGIVGKRTMQVNGLYIRGFITPNYSAIAKALSK